MKLYAYCRVSTERQNVKRQIDNIKAANNGAYAGALFFCDKFTGKTLDRPEWNRLYKRLQSGDTIVFDSVSRMSRDAEGGAALYQELYARGINLVFLNEPHCNTDCYREAAAASIELTGNEIADVYIEATNRVLMILAKRQIIIAFEQAEKERLDICKRVKDGMKAAKDAAAEQGIEKKYGLEEGRKLTTKKSVSAKEVILKHSKDFNGTLADPDVIKLAGISRNSFYKYKAELKQV
jgi:DNA invertase Pin-like site-specific DNA recombinase